MLPLVLVLLVTLSLLSLSRNRISRFTNELESGALLSSTTFPRKQYMQFTVSFGWWCKFCRIGNKSDCSVLDCKQWRLLLGLKNNKSGRHCRQRDLAANKPRWLLCAFFCTEGTPMDPPLEASPASQAVTPTELSFAIFFESKLSKLSSQIYDIHSQAKHRKARIITVKRPPKRTAPVTTQASPSSTHRPVIWKQSKRSCRMALQE